jgi:hypothetical protein
MRWPLLRRGEPPDYSADPADGSPKRVEGAEHVGTRNPAHVDDALAAAALRLDQEALARVDAIMADAVPVCGPSPQTV